MSAGLGEGIFTTWTKLWDTTDTDVKNFNGGAGNYQSTDIVFPDEPDNMLIIFQPSANPSMLVQQLTTGSFLFKSGGIGTLSLATTGLNVANTIRSKYLALVGDNVNSANTDRFSVLKGSAVLFKSASVLKAGDTSAGGITILAISATGKYIVLQIKDDTDGLFHVQVWQGS